MTADKPFRLAFVGECMVELKQAAPGMARQAFAGDTLNSAVYAQRILKTKKPSAFDVHYVSALGEDHFSEAMLAMWQHEGLSTAATRQLSDKAPGLYYIHVDDEGERSFSYWRSDAAAKYMFSGPAGDALLNDLMHFDCLYLSGISLAILPEADQEKLLAALKRYQGKLVFDNNFRPKLWPDFERARTVYKQVLACCDLAILTWDDDQALFGFSQLEQSKEQCVALGVNEIVFKCGSDDCQIYYTGNHYAVPAQKVAQVVDTTAAGDSFSAGYLSARLLGKAPEHAAAWGHQLAATVIQHEGGVIASSTMPTLA